MAKISAGGAHAIARWRGRWNAAIGANELLLTSDGRLLRKCEGRWKAYKRGQTLATAGAQAAMLGYTLR